MSVRGHLAWRPGWFGCVLLVTALSHAVLNGTRALISYRALALGGDAVAVGVITAAFALVPLTVALPVGRAVDRGHGVRTLRTGLALSVVAVLACALSQDLVVLAIGSALLGLGQILYTVAGQSLVPLWSEPGRVDRGFGQLTLAVSVGQFLGFPLAGVLAAGATAAASGGSVETTVPLLTLAAVAACAVPFGYLFVPVTRAVRTRQESASTQQTSRRILASRGMKPAMYSSMTVLTGMDLLTAYLPVLGEQLGLSVGVVTALLTARTVTSVLSRLALPVLLDRVGRRPLLVSATLVSAVPMACVPLTGEPVLLAVAMGVVGFFWGIGQPLTMSWVTDVAHPDNRAAALSIRLAGNRTAQVAVPLVAGGLAGLTGVGTVFVLTGALLMSSGVLSWASTRTAPPA